MSGIFDTLDTLISTTGDIVSSKNAAQIAAETQNNATAANAVAQAQTAATKNHTLMYVGIAAVVILAAVLLLRRR